MPGGDRTGPAGMGPMTGRAAGYCAGYPVGGFMNPVGGRGYGGWGRGGGGGRGRRNRFYATGLTGWQRAGMGWPGAYPPAAGPFGPVGAYGAAPAVAGPTPEQELDALKGQAEYFSDALEDIRRRIEDIESRSAKNAE